MQFHEKYFPVAGKRKVAKFDFSNGLLFICRQGKTEAKRRKNLVLREIGIFIKNNQNAIYVL